MTTFWNWGRRLAEFGPPVTGHAEPTAAPDELSIDAEGWLRGAGVQIVESVRHSRLTTAQGPIAIVWHYTATAQGTAKNLANRIRSYKRGVDRAASWHVCIGSDGVLWQSVPFLRGSWHCAKGLIDGHRVNACTVGIELEGHGKLFPVEQAVAAERLVIALAETYGIRQAHAAHGHVDFDPKRRTDPGLIWSQEILPGILERAYT